MRTVTQVVGYDGANVPGVVEWSMHGQNTLTVPAEVERGESRRQDRPCLQSQGRLNRRGAAHCERLNSDGLQGVHHGLQEPARPHTGQRTGSHHLIKWPGGAVPEVVIEILGSLGKQALQRMVINLPDQLRVSAHVQATGPVGLHGLDALRQVGPRLLNGPSCCTGRLGMGGSTDGRRRP